MLRVAVGAREPVGRDGVPVANEQLAAWLAHRVSLPPGPLFCVIDGPKRGRRWSAAAARSELRQLAVDAGVWRRFAPHLLRHAHAVELAREGVAITSSGASSGTPALGPPARICRGSIRARSSRPCAHVASRRCPPRLG